MKQQAFEKKDFINIAILLTIALVIGVYLIATTVLIAKDGVVYIQQAQKFPIDPISTIKERPPGYSFLIFITHKLFTSPSGNTPLQSWIYCAQGVSLSCRLLALIALYFTGKILIGSKDSFWAVLILIMLPYPAVFGSEVIREWPHILFLAWSLLFLILGSKSGKWQLFIIAGSTAAIGHMIRPECAQTVIYGILWLLIGLFLPRPNIGRIKTLCLIAAILIGFAIPAAPYFKANGKILPPRLKKLISCNVIHQSSEFKQAGFSFNGKVYTASVISTDIFNSLTLLGKEISDNMIYFFVLPLVAGLCDQFRRIRMVWLTEWFFILALIAMYILMMALLNINYGYISGRHCMPIAVFGVFYIPAGLRMLAHWLSRKTSRSRQDSQEDTQRWFFILIAIGFGICIGKFIRITPLRWDRQSFRDAAKWIMENTAPTDIIADSDRRIAFYAERKWARYNEKKIPRQADYIVRIVKSEDEKAGFDKNTKEEYSTWLDKRENRRLVIYKVIR